MRLKEIEIGVNEGYGHQGAFGLINIRNHGFDYTAEGDCPGDKDIHVKCHGKSVYEALANLYVAFGRNSACAEAL